MKSDKIRLTVYYLLMTASLLNAAPPSACRNIQTLQRTDTQVTLDLRWKKPVFIGRNDFYYVIEYSDGETTGNHVVVNKMESVEDVVMNLMPDTHYTFTVTVNNGVSDQDVGREYLQRCTLTTTTMEGSKIPFFSKQKLP